MRFADPLWLYGAAAAPFLLGGIAWYGARAGRRALGKLLSPQAALRLTPPGLIRAKAARAAALTFAAFLLFTAMARPQYGIKPAEAKRSGIDVILLIDVSASMLASDVKPSRMARAKNELAKLAAALEGNRIGIIAFAGESFVECPLTLDLGAVRLFLDSIEAGIIPTPGTAIAQAVEMAVETLSRSGSAKAKAVILVTDGEDLAGQVERAGEAAKRAGVTIHSVGIGSPVGAPIPELDEFGEASGYKKDASGAPLLTRLDVKSLTSLSGATGGILIASQGESLDVSALAAAVNKQEKTDIGSLEYTEYEERYQPLAALALLFLIGEHIYSIWGARKKALGQTESGSA